MSRTRETRGSSRGVRVPAELSKEVSSLSITTLKSGPDTEPALEVRIGQRRRLPVTQYMAILGNVNQSLLELDVRRTDPRTPRLTWGIADLGRSGSELIAQLAPVRVPAKRDPSTLDAPPRDLITGIRALGTEPLIPDHFSAETVERLMTIGRGTTDGSVDHVTLIGLAGGRPEAVVTDATVESAQRAVRVARRAWGSVSGELAVLDSRGRKVRAQVYDRRRRVTVLIYADPERASDLRDAWGREVSVSGPLTRNSAGQPLKLELDRMVLVEPRGERIPPHAILGIDPRATGDLSTAKFMEQVRGS